MNYDILNMLAHNFLVLLTIIIEHVIYITFRFDFYFRHFQCLPSDFIAHFLILQSLKHENIKGKKKPFLTRLLMLTSYFS
jgi:hypothetical protein